MEVFIAFSNDDQIPILERTMEAWAEIEGCEPVGIRAPEGKYELVRRITADNMAEGRYYILADLGCIPDEWKSIPLAQADLVGFKDEEYPSEVRICRRGVVKRWMTRETDDYNKEHAQSIILSGGIIGTNKTHRCKRVAEC